MIGWLLHVASALATQVATAPSGGRSAAAGAWAVEQLEDRQLLAGTCTPETPTPIWTDASSVTLPAVERESLQLLAAKGAGAKQNAAASAFSEKVSARRDKKRGDNARQVEMPASLGEVAAGAIGHKVYAVGEFDNVTLVYNTKKDKWSTRLAKRPQQGHHHAAEVFDGKLYLFGGLGSGAGKVQIYDPKADAWSLGADMPFAAGSVSTARIGSRIFVAGGIVGSRTTDLAAKYIPAKDKWKMIAPMPEGRNHAASGTEGRKFYVFGGRGPGSGDANFVADGFDTVQMYDPKTNAWTIREPLPQARGGMGKAVFADGEFYVMGGETTTGAGANEHRVYDRVDIYNPKKDTWRTGRPMLTARHGIFPVLVGGAIYLPGGGVHAGGSSSDFLEIYPV